MKREIIEFNLVTIVETSSFRKEAKKLISEKEIDEVKNYLAANPEVGDLIPGLRGRWQANQKGKQGGARLCSAGYKRL